MSGVLGLEDENFKRVSKLRCIHGVVLLARKARLSRELEMSYRTFMLFRILIVTLPSPSSTTS